MDRKVVSDDALISTDIDYLIRLISEKKRIDASALARELGMKASMLKKWLAILEEEGYVKIEYHLLNEYVVWAGGELPLPVQEKKPAEPEPEPKTPVPESRPTVFNDLKPAEEKREEFKADERIERIFEKVEKKPDEKTDEITKSILSSFAEEVEKEAKAAEEKPAEEPREEPAPVEEKAPAPEKKHGLREHATRIRFESAKAEPEAEETKAQKAQRDEAKAIAELKKTLMAYMGEIKTQRAELERMKAEKGRLLTDSFAPIEKRFAGAYDSIASRLLEKEGKIIELKERMVEVPAKVDALEKMRKALGEVVESTKGSLHDSQERAERLKKALHEEDERIRANLSDIEKTAKAKKAEAQELARTLASLEGGEKEARKTLDALNRQVGEISRAMLSVNSTLSEISEKRAELLESIDGIKAAVDASTSELAQSYAKLREVRGAEEALNEYLGDYEAKVDEIETYVKEGEKELVKLREFAEMKYMRSYMGELAGMSDKYEAEIEGASAKEKDIDARIDEARKKLDALLVDSRNLVKAIESKTAGANFEGLLAEVKGKQEKTADILREKSIELDKLSTELVSPVPEAAQLKPAKKAKRRRKKKQSD